MFRPIKIRQYLALMKAKGHDAAAVLAGSGVTADMLAARDFLMDIEQARVVVSNMIALTGDQGIGLEIGVKTEMLDLGLMSYLMLSAHSTREATNYWLDYSNALVGMPMRLRLEERAPDLAYDTPSPQSGGSQNMDDAQVFLGALDRFDFKLVGKKEMYIPYNSYKFFDVTTCPDKVKYIKNHSNSDCWRWELHRVWQVDATLRPGFRHSYLKRTFYWDEDAPGSGVGDNYDASGKIYRVSFNAGFALYEAPSWMADMAETHDVLSGVYAESGDTTELGGMVMEKKLPATHFTPEAVAASGVR